MDINLMKLPSAALKEREIGALKKCNDLTSKFNLSLSDTQIKNLIEKRYEALKSYGRIEFGEGILQKLIVEFCDSPYITQDIYEETLTELQEIFYYFKNESLDTISDDELLHFMKLSFDHECEGSLDYLRETALEELCRGARFGYDLD